MVIMSSAYCEVFLPDKDTEMYSAAAPCLLSLRVYAFMVGLLGHLTIAAAGAAVFLEVLH